jgi:hypothetical protein
MLFPKCNSIRVKDIRMGGTLGTHEVLNEYKIVAGKNEGKITAHRPNQVWQSVFKRILGCDAMDCIQMPRDMTP